MSAIEDSKKEEDEEDEEMEKIENFEESIDKCLRKIFPEYEGKCKFNIESVDKSVKHFFRIIGYVLPEDAKYIMSLKCSTVTKIKDTRSLLIREDGTVESLPGRNDPDCFLVTAASRFVKQVMEQEFSPNFRGKCCNGKIRQFLRILDKLPDELELEKAMDIASTFEF